MGRGHLIGAAAAAVHVHGLLLLGWRRWLVRRAHVMMRRWPMMIRRRRHLLLLLLLGRPQSITGAR